MPSGTFSSTNPCCHHDQIENIDEKNARLEDLADVQFSRAVVLAVSRQQFIERHVIEPQYDRLPYTEQDAFIVGAYHAGLISHETACGFVPHIDEERV